MKINVLIIAIVSLFASCKFQYISYNSDENKSRAIKLADEYLKNKNEYSNLLINEVKTA